MSEILPLFPLDLVLFPETPLPLHIFEPRYKEMISECLREKTLFGVVRAVDESLADIGCTAEVVAVTKKYDDGRMDIVTEGRRRFEILNLDHERSFLRAEIEYVTDSGDNAPRDQRERALQLQSELLVLAEAEPTLPELEHPNLAFQLASMLPLDLDFKQTLLSMRSEGDRIMSMIDYYEALLPKIRRSLKARKKAGGNGHVS